MTPSFDVLSEAPLQTSDFGAGESLSALTEFGEKTLIFFTRCSH
jgi:hypothetical protein